MNDFDIYEIISIAAFCLTAVIIFALLIRP
jgi:hypothetical protein